MPTTVYNLNEFLIEDGFTEESYAEMLGKQIEWEQGSLREISSYKEDTGFIIESSTKIAEVLASLDYPDHTTLIQDHGAEDIAVHLMRCLMPLLFGHTEEKPSIQTICTEFANHMSPLSQGLGMGDETAKHWRQIGMICLDILKKSFIIDVDYDEDGMTRLSLSKKMMKKFKWNAETFRRLHPRHAACLVPPRDWTSDKDGGYHSIQIPLVKTKGGNTRTSELDREVINWLQQTPWKINEYMLKVYSKIVEISSDMEMNQSDRSRFLHLQACVLEANRLLEQDTPFYYVWTCDFRLRKYPKASFLNPQGRDADRALIQFAQGAKRTKKNLDKLKSCIAAHMGQDKLFDKERIAWVDDNWYWLKDAADINKVLEFYKKNKSKSIGRAIAAIRQLAHKEPITVPLSRDGSCNGIQHFSAMTLDRETALKVNVVPSYRNGILIRRDIYQEGTDLVKKRHVEFGFLERDHGKNPIMTYPYGCGAASMGEAFFAKWGTDYLTEEVCHSIGQAYHKAIADLLPGSKIIIKWLRDQVGLFNGVNPNWTIRCTGSYIEQKAYIPKKIYASYRDKDGKTVKMASTFYVPTDEDLDDTHVRGILPNFTHSYDQAHMSLIILELKKMGCRWLSPVHDASACRVDFDDKNNKVIRETFIEVHKENVLTRLYNELKNAGYNPDPVPALGDLDLNEVKNSPAFFL